MWALACLPGHGALRLVEQVLDTALDTNPELSILTRDDVVAALQQLKGQKAQHLQMLARRHVNLNRAEVPIAKAG